MKEKEEYLKKQSQLNKEEEKHDEVGESMIATDSPAYQNYSEEAYEALKGQKPLVLYFHAQWCSLCRAQDKNITANLMTFPEKTEILKVDYDKEETLKQEYGITIQTSFVILDSTGKVSSIVRDPSLDDLKAAITKSL